MFTFILTVKLIMSDMAISNGHLGGGDMASSSSRQRDMAVSELKLNFLNIVKIVKIVTGRLFVKLVIKLSHKSKSKSKDRNVGVGGW